MRSTAVDRVKTRSLLDHTTYRPERRRPSRRARYRAAVGPCSDAKRNAPARSCRAMNRIERPHRPHPPSKQHTSAGAVSGPTRSPPPRAGSPPAVMRLVTAFTSAFGGDARIGGSQGAVGHRSEDDHDQHRERETGGEPPGLGAIGQVEPDSPVPRIHHGGGSRRETDQRAHGKRPQRKPASRTAQRLWRQTARFGAAERARGSGARASGCSGAADGGPRPSGGSPRGRRSRRLPVTATGNRVADECGTDEAREHRHQAEFEPECPAGRAATARRSAGARGRRGS